MGADTKIEWCDFTFNPWRGCTKVSAGCANCYADTMSKRNRMTLGVWGPNGTRVVAAESTWKLPLRWNRDAAKSGDRPRVFCASMADVFEDWQGPMLDAQGRRLWVSRCVGANDVPDFIPERPQCDFSQCRPLTMSDVRRRLFGLIDATPNLDWLILSKRPENMLRMMGPEGVGLYAHANGPVPCPQPNLWLGTSVENQATADERIPHLLRVPAAVRFLSVEPLLGPVEIDKGRRSWLGSFVGTSLATGEKRNMPGIDWVIVGGESGPGARPCNVDWIRDIVRQCREAGVPCFVKQLGSAPQMTWREYCQWKDNPPAVDCHPETLDAIRFRDRKGGDMAEWPDDLRVREMPVVKEATS